MSSHPGPRQQVQFDDHANKMLLGKIALGENQQALVQDQLPLFLSFFKTKDTTEPVFVYFLINIQQLAVFEHKCLVTYRRFSGRAIALGPESAMAKDPRIKGLKG